MRKAHIERNTLETKIDLSLVLEGSGNSNIKTGIGFFDHMLIILAKHSFIDLDILAKGDLEVDSHHTIEDCGIVLGMALKEALGDKAGIQRYGNSFVPMDESLGHVCLDFSARGLLVWNADIPRVMIGNFDAEMVEEFFRAVAVASGMTLHVRLIYGKNTHHIVEAIFKAFARALKEAIKIDPEVKGVLSSKGVL